MKSDLKVAKKIIVDEVKKSGLVVRKVILFGSRARGNFSRDSDWDLMVVVKGDLTRERKRSLIANVYKRLAKIDFPCDILVKTEEEFNRMKSIVGSFSYEAEVEGICL